MKLKLLAGVFVIALGLMTGMAMADAHSSHTTIKIEGTKGATVQHFRVYGTVSSPNARCVSGRKVKILSVTPNGPKLIDTDRAGDDGFFSGGGNFGHQVDGVRVKAVRRDIGRNGHRHVCERATDSVRIV